MSDLNDEDRSLFDAARAGYEPNQADRKRVLATQTTAGSEGGGHQKHA